MFEELCENTDDNLFSKTCMTSNHVLHSMLPPQSAESQHYSLRFRSHSLSLPDHDNHLSDCNFITRMLGLNSAIEFLTFLFNYRSSSLLSVCLVAVCQLV